MTQSSHDISSAPPPGALTSPAAGRNRGPILDVLAARLPTAGLVLEIASGSGEHAVFAAAAFPGVTWQPTDQDDAALASIAAWRAQARLPNLRAPLHLDASKPDSWPVSRADAILAVNMIHIAPWAATEGLIAGAGRVLSPGGFVYLYGPFIEAGLATLDSNLAFDASLRSRDPAWGLRHLDDVVALARRHGLMLSERVEMPANNLSLFFRKV